MMRTQFSTLDLFRYGFLALALLLTGTVFVLFFRSLPIEGTSLGIDRIFWAFDGGDIFYQGHDGLRNPPWSVLILIPTGFMDDRTAWGLLVFFTLAVQITSVPHTAHRWRYWLATLLVVVSFPSLRNIADANLEGLIVAGGVLAVAGYRLRHPWILAAGILLVTAKPQASILLVLVLGVYVLQTWPRRLWLKTGVLVLAVVIPTLIWRGQEWLAAVRGTYQAGSIIDVSLSAALDRIGGVPVWLIVAVQIAFALATLVIAWRADRSLSREKAGMLVAAGLLLAPYAAGNSVVSVLAIGMIPL
ncbi:MAG: glycosyltransferase 87 family protein, partial [Phototrophicaceae bacterium]